MENKNNDSDVRFSLLELGPAPSRGPKVTIKPDPIIVLDLSDDTDEDDSDEDLEMAEFDRQYAESQGYTIEGYLTGREDCTLSRNMDLFCEYGIGHIFHWLARLPKVAPAPFVADPATGAYAMLIGLAMWMAARCARPSENDRAIGAVFSNLVRYTAIPAPAPVRTFVIPTPAQMAADTARIAANRRNNTGNGMSADAFAGDTVDSSTVSSLYTCNACKTRDQQIAFGGEGAEGLGRRIGWNGRGECTIGQIADTLAEFALPVEWAPTSKSVRAHAGKAVSALSASGYVPRCERKALRAKDADYSARWHVGAIGSVAKTVGGSFGRTVLIVTLTSMGTLTFDYDLDSTGGYDLAERVRVEFARTTSGDVMKAGEVTEWIKKTMRNELWAIDTGNGMYVRKQYAEVAHTLKKAMSGIFGRNWEAWPVATHAEVKDSLCTGLANEVTDLADALKIARDVARKAGREDVTESTGVRYVKRLTDIAKRVQAFADLLGAERVADVRKVANDLLESLSVLVSDTAIRGRLIWDDIAQFDDGPMKPSTNDTTSAFKG
jgi:hypothetical protein